MSALGQKRSFSLLQLNVCFAPKADICRGLADQEQPVMPSSNRQQQIKGAKQRKLLTMHTLRLDKGPLASPPRRKNLVGPLLENIDEMVASHNTCLRCRWHWGTPTGPVGVRHLRCPCARRHDGLPREFGGAGAHGGAGTWNRTQTPWRKYEHQRNIQQGPGNQSVGWLPSILFGKMLGAIRWQCGGLLQGLNVNSRLRANPR